jgi:hypothetical protein
LAESFHGSDEKPMLMKSIVVTPAKNNIIQALLFTGALVSILWSVYFSLVTISIPYQIEFREGTAQVLTGLFLRGQNPFRFENQPLAMNNYGIGYNLVVLPFAAIFGNTLFVHRSVTFFFVILSGLAGFWVVYKKQKNISVALVCSAFILIALIGRAGIGAFPSALGTFLFLVAILIPFLRSFDSASLTQSVFLSLLAFYTKPYFLLSFGIVFSYLLLFVSKKKSLIYGTVFIGLFTALIMIVRYVFPLYFINILISNMSNSLMSFDNLLNQLRELLYSFYPVLLLLVVTLALPLYKKEYPGIQRSAGGSLVNLSAWNLPLVGLSFNFLLYSFICSMLAFLFILGPHTGNFMNYAFQLLIPTFFCWFLGEYQGLQKFRILFIFVLLINLFIWEQKLLDPLMLEQKNSTEWARLFEYVHSSNLTLNSPAVASEVAAQGQIPMDSGQTTYYYQVKPFSDNLVTGTAYDKFYNDGFLYTLLIDRMIQKQRFDLVITTTEKAVFYHDKKLPEYYLQVATINLDMPQMGQHWTMVLWKPRQK